MKKTTNFGIRIVCIMIFAWGAVIALVALSIAIASTVSAQNTSSAWKSSFDLNSCNFASSGANTYFILEPGYGTETRVVEERESENGELIEVSRNYFAVCTPSNDVYYFGEEVDNYEDGEIVSHEGAWLAGIDDARAGIIMPGRVEVGFRHYQEVAPGIAEDRAEIISLNDTLNTPAGAFTNVLKTEETNPLEPDEKEFKYYAPGVGLIQDETLQLVNYTSSNNE